jgi:hypothetical protein
MGIFRLGLAPDKGDGSGTEGRGLGFFAEGEDVTFLQGVVVGVCKYVG